MKPQYYNPDQQILLQMDFWIYLNTNQKKEITMKIINQKNNQM